MKIATATRPDPAAPPGAIKVASRPARRPRRPPRRECPDNPDPVDREERVAAFERRAAEGLDLFGDGPAREPRPVVDVAREVAPLARELHAAAVVLDHEEERARERARRRGDEEDVLDQGKDQVQVEAGEGRRGDKHAQVAC